MPSFRHPLHHGVPGQEALFGMPMPSRVLVTPRAGFRVRGECHCDDGPRCVHQGVFDACCSTPGTELHELCVGMNMSPRILWRIMITELRHSRRVRQPGYWEHIYRIIVSTSNGRLCGMVTDDPVSNPSRCRLGSIRVGGQQQYDDEDHYDLRQDDHGSRQVSQFPGSTWDTQQYMERHSGRSTGGHGSYHNSTRGSVLGGGATGATALGAPTPLHHSSHHSHSHQSHGPLQSHRGSRQTPDFQNHQQSRQSPGPQERSAPPGSAAGSNWSGAEGRERRRRLARIDESEFW